MSNLFWLHEVWPGKLALAARPRGGDWLPDEVTNWKRVGVSTVLSLLEPEEESDLDLEKEAEEVRRQGLDFQSLPIPDRRVPPSEAKLIRVLDNLDTVLLKGRSVLIHCRQGVGRSGLVAACLLVRKGLSPGAAFDEISAARGVTVPETEEQREWIGHFATAISK